VMSDQSPNTNLYGVDLSFWCRNSKLNWLTLGNLDEMFFFFFFIFFIKNKLTLVLRQLAVEALNGEGDRRGILCKLVSPDFGHSSPTISETT